MADKYIENADAHELARFIQTIPENLRDIYEDTRGILIYQEQVILLAQRMAGFTLGGADAIRKATSKKSYELIDALGAEFIYGSVAAIPMLEKEIVKLEAAGTQTRDKKRDDRIYAYKSHIKDMQEKIDAERPVAGAINKGYDEDYCHQIYDGVRRFGGYSFNRSHSAAYALIAYWTAWLKTHYSVEFMAAQLSVEANDTDNKKERKIVKNVAESRRLEIDLLPADINKSEEDFTIESVTVTDDEGNITTKKAIRFGMQAVKGVGPAVMSEILARPARGDDASTIGTPYKDFDDFYHRVNKRTINKAHMRKLIESGCFDYDIENRHQLWNHFCFNLRKDKQFDGTEKEFAAQVKLKKIKADTAFMLNPKDYTEQEIADFEGEYFGCYVTNPPYQDLVYQNWEEVLDTEPVDMGGKIVAIKLIKTKGGDQMAKVDVETAGGKISVTVFPKTYQEYLPELFKGNIAIFRGTKQASEQYGDSLLLNQILKVRKKKYQIAKPPELEELAEQRKIKGGYKPKVTLEDLGGVSQKKDPTAEESPDELSELAMLFD